MTEYLKQVKLTLVKKEGIESFKAEGSYQIQKVLRDIIPADSINVHESVVAVFFNQNNESVGWFQVSQGGINQSVVDLRMVFSAALNCLATAIIMCHNHPSGNIKPSQDDIKITKKLKDGGDILNIKLLDHIIITEESYYSFADEGLI